MLKALEKLPFALIWPGNWEDIGFTERPIWVNAKGYGYIMCDEPCSSLNVEGLPLAKWFEIRSKLVEGSLQVSDIEGTSLEELLNEVTHGFFDEDDDLCEALKGLSLLPDEKIDQIWGVETFDGWEFFSTEESFKKAYERDWADERWENLPDDILSEWIDRLCEEEDTALIKWSSRMGLEKKPK